MRNAKHKVKQVNNNDIMLITLLFILLFSIMIGHRFVLANDNTTYEKTFISIEIQEGDTLTSIAHTYAKNAIAYNDYILEVKDINNLHNDTIHSGCYLLIPTYEEVVE
ncbi:MAG: LysM peptidoglycan-binding domain-containing protein [Oscillospiraceae bacterium]|nr:LysM peptidoglycan-binding domain-containing protein [Oscillospiraceae bacterium]